MKKKIVFITGTRADYGKIKNVIQGLQSQNYFNVSLFVTGIHNLKDFGSTYLQIISDNIKNITRYNNQKFNEPMDKVFYKTCEGFSSFIKKKKPDYILTNIGGGVQEVLGLYLKKNLKIKSTILCTGAAISFFTGDQAPINSFIDRYYLGWFVRLIFNPYIFF